MCPVKRQEGFPSKATKKGGTEGIALMCLTKNKTWQHEQGLQRTHTLNLFVILSQYNQDI